MEIKSYGKVNLTLKVYKNNRKRNLHKINSIMFPYQELFDIITVKKNNTQQFNFQCNLLELNNNENTIVKAYQAFLQEFPEFKEIGIDIFLDKKTPVGSGLGYSSSNQVATIKLLCRIFKIDFNSKKVLNLIKSLSCDALFFYYQKPARLLGYGNQIHLLSKHQITKYEIPNCKVIISNIPSITKDVYAEFDLDYSYYKKRNRVFPEKYFNMLEKPALKINQKLKEFHHTLTKQYSHVLLAGSGGSFLVW
ncbi:4-diphosphocytidyl-2C-methyl-D-erythritol kinase [Spiroplasma sp. DGKH1]|uniref:GHMP family kinase ATP-binding protein n=1 Tax=Spiroplasma sp. DGKH1 TaxID=3050074 RepID=UPI0034C5DDFA